MRATLVVCCAALVAASVVLSATAAQSPPAFRGSVELLTIRVQVVADRGKPLPDLSTGQFDVRIAGRKQRVLVVKLVRSHDGLAAVDPLPHEADAGAVGNRDFFKPFANQASAEYLIGVEAGKAGRVDSVRVKVTQKNLSVRRWAWCGLPTCTTSPALSVPDGAALQAPPAASEGAK